MVNRKRIVLHHATGLLAGLHQIVGVVEGKDASAEYPTTIGYGLRGKQRANHDRTFARYVQYREWAQAARGKFNDFNPAQV